MHLYSSTFTYIYIGKIHSINAKRGVLRSQAYDLLHQIYQAKQSKSIHFSQKLNSSSIGVKDGSVIGLGLGLESLERIDDKVFQENLKRRYVAGEVCLSGTGIFVTGVGSGMHVHVATLDWKKFQAKKRLRCSLMALYATKD